MSFKEIIEESLLQKLDAVLNIKQSDDNNWQIETSDTELIRKQIMELVIQKNLNLVSLHTETSNLEAIFRELTK